MSWQAVLRVALASAGVVSLSVSVSLLLLLLLLDVDGVCSGLARRGVVRMVRRRRKRSGRRRWVVGVAVCIFDKCGGFEVGGGTARERLRFFSLARFERLWFLGLVVEEGRTWSFYVDYYIVKGFRWHPSWRLWKSFLGLFLFWRKGCLNA